MLGYFGGVALAFGVSLAALIGIAWLYNRFVERGFARLQDKLFSKLEKK